MGLTLSFPIRGTLLGYMDRGDDTGMLSRTFKTQKLIHTD